MKKLIQWDDECPSYLWDAGEQVDLTKNPILAQTAPCELHLLPDGSVTDDPSFCFVLPIPGSDRQFVAQITLAKMMIAVKTALDIYEKKHGEVTVPRPQPTQ